MIKRICKKIIVSAFVTAFIVSNVFSQNILPGETTAAEKQPVPSEKDNKNTAGASFSKENTKESAGKNSKNSSAKENSAAKSDKNGKNPSKNQNDGKSGKNSDKNTSDKNSSGKKDSKNTSDKNDKNKSSANKFVSENISKTTGDLKITLRGSRGTFNIASLDKEGSSTSLTETYDEYTSSFFSILIGTNEYRLQNKTGIVTGARKTESGGQLSYNVQKKANVVVDFKCIKSEAEKPENVIRVEIGIKNLGKHEEYFGFKTVLDTVLGEKLSQHFYAASGKLPDCETQFKHFDDVKYIVSKNQKTGMAVLFTGADTTKPEAVSVGNKDDFLLSYWIPAVSEGKPFDSVFSYNNSAVGIVWPSEIIKSGEKRSIVFYIVTSNDYADPAAMVDKFTANFGKISEAAGSSAGKTVIGPNGEKIDAAYIQRLIDKINSLNPDDNIDREELFQLNKEIEAAMRLLRS